MVPEALLSGMMLMCVMIVCLWTNCNKRAVLAEGQFTVPGKTFEV